MTTKLCLTNMLKAITASCYWQRLVVVFMETFTANNSTTTAQSVTDTLHKNYNNHSQNCFMFILWDLKSSLNITGWLSSLQQLLLLLIAFHFPLSSHVQTMSVFFVESQSSSPWCDLNQLCHIMSFPIFLKFCIFSLANSSLTDQTPCSLAPTFSFHPVTMKVQMSSVALFWSVLS